MPWLQDVHLSTVHGRMISFDRDLGNLIMVLIYSGVISQLLKMML